ncbi:MAG: flagellar biosynthetic protein FliO [Anaeromyxobacter sp.]|nr:flagellar biosynthetic protein FliO [Anaeromyxobacter sp.]MBL0276177.1 flagellar biosynthetic protein FliO [Anaeromyxobacter sp.]
MTPALLALTLSLADPLGFPSPPAALAVAAPATTSAPDQPQARTPTAPPPPLTLPAESGFGLGSLALPAAALLALAGAALWASRRTRATSRYVQVLETTSLGPKRSLVVARLGGELLVIGASEAGLQLLAARPATLDDRAADGPAEALAARLRPVPDLAPEGAPPAHPVLGLLSRLRRAPAAPAHDPATFDSLLAESAEDQELRRKLANGQAGSVR